MIMSVRSNNAKKMLKMKITDKNHCGNVKGQRKDRLEQKNKERKVEKEQGIRRTNREQKEHEFKEKKKGRLYIS